MQRITKWHSAMLGVLVSGFAGTWMTGACGSSGPGESACSTPAADPPVDQPTTCPAPVEEPCMRYRLELLGDPTNNLMLRANYLAAFRDACYLSEANTFDCWYKTWEKACEDAALIGEVSKNTAYDKGYTCQPDGAGNYWLQTGSDPSIRTWIYLGNAPRQTPLVEVDGMLVEVNGPYRNLPEPPTLGLAQPFNKCFSGMFDANGATLSQTEYILQVNRNTHGKIHSDLAGFKWPCKVMNENCEEVMAECEEPLELAEPPKKKDNEQEEDAPFVHPGLIARVHHVVPMTDRRSCAWGTNSNKMPRLSLTHSTRISRTRTHPKKK